MTVQGPVWAPALGRFKVFRYEVRRWLNGTIADIAYAVASPQRVSDDEHDARRVLELAEMVPAYVWGRNESYLGEMWNSNSVISWAAFLWKPSAPRWAHEPRDGAQVSLSLDAWIPTKEGDMSSHGLAAQSARGREREINHEDPF